MRQNPKRRTEYHYVHHDVPSPRQLAIEDRMESETCSLQQGRKTCGRREEDQDNDDEFQEVLPNEKSSVTGKNEVISTEL
jgi:hypothetical protein